MRIISELPIGGVERRLLALLPRLKAAYDVQVCCIRERGVMADDFERAGIPVVLKFFKGRLHPESLYRLARYMREQKIDIVHTHMYRPNISGVVAAKLAGVPVIISNVHSVGHWGTTRQMVMDSMLGRWRNRVVTISEAVKSDYVKKTGADPNKCVVIYNGIDLEAFTRPVQNPRLKGELGIGADDKVVGIVARLVDAKDHATFFRAAKIVQQNIPRVKFLVVGEEDAQPGVLAQLEAQVAELGLTAQVIFTGIRQDIPDLLSVMDVSVLSSIREGFSNTIVESMACGVPMVATDVGGNAEAIVNGYTGFVVPPKAPAPLAEAIIKVLKDEPLAASMRQASKERARLFSLECMCQNTIELYDKLLAEKKQK